jgi:PAS domain S-box-containing protein
MSGSHPNAGSNKHNSVLSQTSTCAVKALTWLLALVKKHSQPAPGGEDKPGVAKTLADHTREIEQANQDLENQIAQRQVESDLNVLLTLSLENHSLADMLSNLLDYLTALPWLALTGAWAVYLRRTDDNGLALCYSSKCPEEWPLTFPVIPSTNCLCGIAPDLVASGVCAQSFKKLPDYPLLHHPHYGLPLLNNNAQAIGQLVLFAIPGSTPDPPLQTFLVAVANILVGVIQRKQAEESLCLERDRSNQYLANAGITFLILDAEGNVQFLNRKGCEVTGWAIANLLGRNWFSLFVPDRVRDEVQAFYKNLVTHGQKDVDYFYENPIINRAGQERLIAWHATLITRPDGTFESILASGEDITEQKRLQVQLLQAQKLESIGQLAAGVAHEINTPTQYVGDNIRFLQESFQDLSLVIKEFFLFIAAVKSGQIPAGMIAEIEETLKQADIAYLTEEIPKAVEQALEGVNRVATIVRAMKEFAHPDSAEIALTNINHAIESTVTISRNEWKYVADVETDFDADLPEISCLAGQFNQVILNMLVNAAHAIAEALGPSSNKKGTITIKTLAQGPWAIIQITDTGTGIPAEVLPKIFDPFFTTKKVGQGSGQGLAISHNVIVEKLKGKIDVATEWGKGTTFTLCLPLREIPAEVTLS